MKATLMCAVPTKRLDYGPSCRDGRGGQIYHHATPGFFVESSTQFSLCVAASKVLCPSDPACPSDPLGQSFAARPFHVDESTSAPVTRISTTAPKKPTSLNETPDSSIVLDCPTKVN